jgi:tetratricopeptide (TPR) repeat protein
VEASSPEEDLLEGFRPVFPSLLAYISSSYRDASYFRHLAAAEMHVERGRAGDAAKGYETVLRQYRLDDEEAAPIHLAVGHVYSNLSLWIPAEESFRSALRSRAILHVSHTALGSLHARRGRFRDAARAFEAALYIRPSYFPAMHALGSVHLIEGDIDGAMRMYGGSIRLLEEAGVLPPRDDDKDKDKEKDRDDDAAGGKGLAKGPGAAMSGETLKAHLIAHVLRVCALPTGPSAPDAATTGRSLRTFLHRLQTLDLAAFHRGVGLRLLDAGAFEEGVRHLRRAIALNPSEYGYLLLYSTLAMPLVFSSGEEVMASRAGLTRNVREALEDRVVVTHPERLFELYALTYQLPFTGLPSNLLMLDIARLFASSEVPVLDIPASPSPYWTFPFALAHATGNPAWSNFAPHRYPGAPPAPSGSFIRQTVDDYFVFGGPSGETVGEGGAAAAAAAAVDLASRASTIVRVGFLTYQLHDCPVGHLFHRLIMHLRGYSAAQAKVVARGGQGCGGGAASSSSSAAAGGVASAQQQQHSRDMGSVSCTFSEAPSEGGGTMPRFFRDADFDDWRATASVELDPSGTLGDDPMLSLGYITVPGVAAFHITLFRVHYMGDNMTERLNRAAHHVEMLPSRPFDLEAARNAIAKQKLDVLVASDPGIQSEMYTLLFSRMAPVQVALWGSDKGHALTLGLPSSVDYYVVGDGEADDALQAQMQEQTVRLGDLGVFSGGSSSGPVTDQDRLAVSSRLGLLEGRSVYLVPQCISGLHPAFDAVLVGILTHDPAAEIFLLHDVGDDLWLAKLQTRLQGAPGMTRAMYERIRFLLDFPPSRTREKRALMSASEVVLDTFPVGIGVAALEALDVGTPVVTLPSKQPLRQPAAAALRRMGVEADLVANDTDAYVRAAVRLATDPQYRRGVKQAIVGRRAAYQWGAAGIASGSGSGSGSSGAKGEATAWRNVSQHVGQVSDPAASAANEEHLAQMQMRGYGDAALGALNDWLRFLGRAGRPWAEDREATELEVESAAAGGAGAGGGGGAGGAGGSGDGSGGRGGWRDTHERFQKRFSAERERERERERGGGSSGGGARRGSRAARPGRSSGSGGTGGNSISAGGDGH